MKRLNQRPFVSIYNDAPDKLLEAIANLNDLIIKSKTKGVSASSLKFYEDLAETMRFSYNYMIDVAFIVQRNIFLESENHFLKKWAGEQMNRLELYEGVREAINNDSLGDIIRDVKKAMAKLKENS